MLTWWLRRIWFGKKSCIVTTIFLSNSYWQLFPIYMRLVGSLSMFLFLDAELWAIDNAARPGTLVLPKLLIGSAVGASPKRKLLSRYRYWFCLPQPISKSTHRLTTQITPLLKCSEYPSLDLKWTINTFLSCPKKLTDSWPKSVIISYILVWWVTQIYSNNLDQLNESWISCWDTTQVT